MKGERRKAQILRAAVSVFAEHGYEKTSIAMICEKVKIGRETLYQYFRDKNALFKELIEVHAGRIEALMGATVFEEEVSSLEELLYLKLYKVLSEIRENKAIYQILLHEAPARNTGVNEHVRKIRQRMVNSNAEELRLGSKLGLFQVDDPELIGAIFIGATLLAAEYYLFDAEVPADAEELARKVARFQLRYLTGTSG